MRRSPRLVRGNHDRAGTPGSLPRTPHHPKSGPVLDDLIASIETEFHLVLKVRDESWTPQKSDGAPLADKVYGQIQHLFYSSQPTLHNTIDDFRIIVKKIEKSQQLSCLSKLLVKCKTRSPPSRVGTPASRPQKILTDAPALNYALPPPSSGRPNIFSNYAVRPHESESESYQTAIDDPGSPTDVEEDADDAFYTPPSPTLAAMKRRDHAEPAQLVTSPIVRKRSLQDSSITTSPKFSRTNNGKEPSELYPQLPKPTSAEFKIPSKDLLRSFTRVDPSAMSSVNTSFATQSSQQTLVDPVESAATSFATDVSHDELLGHKLSAKGSWHRLTTQFPGTIDCRAETDKFEQEKQREQDRIFSQELTRESVSTYGSIDEDVLYTAEHRVVLKQEGVPGFDYPPPSAQPHPMDAAKPRFPVSPKHVADAKTGGESKSDTASPQKIPFWIQKLPDENILDSDNMTSDMELTPYFLMFIVRRVALTMKGSFREMLAGINRKAAQSNPDALWSSLEHHGRVPLKEPATLWSASEKSFEGYTFSGKVRFDNPKLRLDPSSASVFKLESLAMQQERSCLLQRMFGSERFLYLTFASDAPDWFTAEEMALINDHLRMWMMQEHAFLGRRWRAFHIKNKRKKSSRKDDTSTMRLILFATEGVGLNTISVGTMMNAFFHFHKNQHQPFTKAFARFDLALTNTTATIVFKRSQIRSVPDTFADGTPEATEFNDNKLQWLEQKDWQGVVMNDGVAQISVGAALLIWAIVKKETGLEGPLPSAFQGRIGAAKGVWIISAEPHTSDPAHLAIWIEISDSQRKAIPADENIVPAKPHNEHLHTFNYYKHAHVKGSSELHTSFIQILEDRGVSRDTISKAVLGVLEAEREKLLDIILDPIRLHNWIAKQAHATAEHGILSWQGSLPVALSEKVKHLLRSGLLPDQNPYLGKIIKKYIRQYYISMEEKLRAPIGKSTFLMGVADPFGVLKPGEVQINFSKPFLDEYDGQTYRTLAGMQVLVARQPACRRSDVQKMRAVSHPQLAHLVDVIVFPSRGQFPAAGKLQGGDYDGDTFWSCWQEDLVKDFLNAPAPSEPPIPGNYGIRQEHRKLEAVMNVKDPSSVDGFLREAFDFAMQDSLLGTVTNFADSLAYKLNRIHDPVLSLLHDLHDLLVDAAKQGYTLTKADWDSFKQKHGLQWVSQPAYKTAMDFSVKHKYSAEEETDPRKKPKLKPREDNINDYLYFFIMVTHNKETRSEIEKRLPKNDTNDNDPDLRYPYLNLKASNDPIIAQELKRLNRAIKEINWDWNRSLGDRSDLKSEAYNLLVDKCHIALHSIQPSPANCTHPSIAPLTTHYLGPNHPTIWETIRVSALYTEHSLKHSFVWMMCGRELTRLKAGSNVNTYHVVPGIFADHRTKPCKKIVGRREGDGEEDDDGFKSALEDLGGV